MYYNKFTVKILYLQRATAKICRNFIFVDLNDHFARRLVCLTVIISLRLACAEKHSR